MKQVIRHLADRMAPRKDASLLAAADAARDSRDWEKAVSLYREFVKRQPARDGILMQAGHCLKAMGALRAAYAEYVAVQEPSERPEAMFHAGLLLKLAGNSAAAAQALGWSAARGQILAVGELDRMASASGPQHLDAFKLATAAGPDDHATLTRLFSLESAPLDWRGLATAAEDCAVLGLRAESEFFADFALIVGGLVLERQPTLKAVFENSGLWPGRHHTLFAQPSSRATPAQAIDSLLSALDASAQPSRSRPADFKTYDVGHIVLLEADDPVIAGTLARCAAALTKVRSGLFAPAGETDAALVEAIGELGALFPRANRRIYATLPEAGAYDVTATARRVCLNVVAAVADRLTAILGTVMGTPQALKAAFAIPTRRATLAIASSGDKVPAALSLAMQSEDPVKQARLAELAAVGVFSGAAADGFEQLKALANKGSTPLMYYWLAVHAPSMRPAMASEIAIRVSNALNARGATEEGLYWAEHAYAYAPMQFGMDVGIKRKTNGDFAGAARAFAEVLEAQPDNTSAASELNQVVRECCSADEIAALAAAHPAFGAVYRVTEATDQDRRGAANATGNASLAAVLTLSDLSDTVDFGHERLECHQIGWLRAGTGLHSVPRLVGIVALRLCHYTRDPPLRMRVRINGKTVDIVDPSPSSIDTTGIRKYYFNSWIDTRGLPRGGAQLQAYVEQRSSGYSIFETTVLIDEAKDGEAYPRSDADVPASWPIAQGATLVEHVLAIPATARDSMRSAYDRPIERILVMRLDQLGDLSASMPAIRRLKTLFPQARFEGLVTPINAYILGASGLFDEVFCVDFTYDHDTRRRWLSRSGYGEVKRRYADAPVDLAIDLSPGDDSRPILQLVNARYRAGFKPHQFDFLDFGIDVITRDPVNRREAVSHTAMISAFIEALATMLQPPPPRFPVDPALERHLEPLGLAPAGYIAIHTGARLAIKRWPLAHYLALTELLRAETGQEIVLFFDDPISDEQAAAIAKIGGVHVKAGRMEFEIFDALLSFAKVFIGNDTGPKHMAAIRGVKTVSVHMDQVNWNEWGQDGEGLIVSKRVPCCGCGIEDPTECGKAMACLDGLSPRDVADAVKRAMKAAGPRDAPR